MRGGPPGAGRKGGATARRKGRRNARRGGYRDGACRQRVPEKPKAAPGYMCRVPQTPESDYDTIAGSVSPVPSRLQTRK